MRFPTRVNDVLHLCFLLFIYFYKVKGCDPNNYCKPEQWANWTPCNAVCGRGVTRREKYICCNPVYKSIDDCLRSCGKNKVWWEANGIETKSCVVCKNYGMYNDLVKRCICKAGFGGACCNGMKSI